jgi:hypothetical protein
MLIVASMRQRCAAFMPHASCLEIVAALESSWNLFQVFLIERTILSNRGLDHSLGCIRVKESDRGRFTELRLIPLQQLPFFAVHRDTLFIRLHFVASL